MSSRGVIGCSLAPWLIVPCARVLFKSHSAESIHSTMNINDLPPEIVALLPDYLHSLDDLYSLLHTSRTFYRCCALTRARLSPPFAKKHGQHLLSPHPLLILAGTARQIGEWAVSSKEGRQELWDSIDGGVDRLAELSSRIAHLSLDDVRALHRVKFDIINPMTAQLDLEEGHGQRQRYRDDSEIEHASWWTICEDVERTIYNYLIYCELFYLDVRKVYDNSLELEPLGPEFRQHWMSYCMPDSNFPFHHPRPTPDECQLLDFSQLIQCSNFINRLSKVIPTPPPNVSIPEQERYEFLTRIMEHQGLTTLQLVHAGKKEPNDSLYQTIGEKVNQLPQFQIVVCPEYDDPSPGGTRHLGWFSMEQDFLCLVGND